MFQLIYFIVLSLVLLESKHGLAFAEIHSTQTVNENIQTKPVSKFSSKPLMSSTPVRRLEPMPARENVSEEVEAFRELFKSTPEIDWQLFTPPPATDINCFIEVQVTKKVPGKCTKLAGKIPACQGSNFLSIDYNSC